ncbi:MAG: hypothetical protein Q7R83_03895 [bacterium]|nr:hypothetical protein [bacterium]
MNDQIVSLLVSITVLWVVGLGLATMLQLSGPYVRVSKSLVRGTARFIWRTTWQLVRWPFRAAWRALRRPRPHPAPARP